MKRGRKGGRRVFSIIIGGIFVTLLATVIVPWYWGHIERKRVTEAVSIMGAIITSQMVEGARTGKYYSASTIAEFKAKGIDITDTKYFTYETVATPDGGFTVTATATDAFSGSGELTFTKEPGKKGYWGTDEGLEFDDRLPPPFEFLQAPGTLSVLSWGAEGEPIGAITAIEGEVWLAHKGDKASYPAMLGDPIYLYDRIQTEIASCVQILFEDESLLNLAENTYIQITEHIYSPEENRRSAVIKLLMGRVRVVVGRSFAGPGSRYIISTPTDTIAVEHGRFVVDAAAGRIQ